MSDLDLLKAITEREAAEAEPGGRFDKAEEAVSRVLHILRENTNPTWEQVYGAIRDSYAGEPDWVEGE